MKIRRLNLPIFLVFLELFRLDRRKYEKLHGNARPQARQVLFSKPVFQGYCSVTRERHVWMFPIPNMVKYFVVIDQL